MYIRQAEGAAGDHVTFTYEAGFTGTGPFLWDYDLWTKRGLSGTRVTVAVGTTNTPRPTTDSSKTVAELLQGHPRCAIAANLYVRAKTTNGMGLNVDRSDQIAFALQQT